MFANTLSDAALKARIDTPDLTEALAADTEGTFAAEVTTYLNAWKDQLRAYQDAGLPTAEFESLTRLSDSVHTAGRVLEFFVKMQRLSALQTHEN